MFRNPRDNTNIDVGRPPSPAGSIVATQVSTPPLRHNIQTTAAVQPQPVRRTPKSSMKPSAPPSAKRSGNASILSFFKKAEVGEPKEQENESLFLSDDDGESPLRKKSQPVILDQSISRRVEDRYNESLAPSKKQRTEVCVADESAVKVEEHATPTPGQEATVLQEIGLGNTRSQNSGALDRPATIEGANTGGFSQSRTTKQTTPTAGREADQSPPSLKKEETSMNEDEFEGINDFVDDEFPEDGEEYVARQWMEEQRMMELDFEGDDNISEAADCEPEPGHATPGQTEQNAVKCPICAHSLKDLGDHGASRHVNDCLDGKSPTLVDMKPDVAEIQRPNVKQDPDSKPDAQQLPKHPPHHRRFQRAAIARPAQENPFSLDPAAAGGSAFSRLMASHAEDSAWAQAAANDMAARGKPAYKRTCPFYKILPGFSTCVDAFRYGAVEGCHAYFLSHFHSDHYIGLTSTWCHGPIYCSRVTGNLVRQQLRVDPKWVVDLEWNNKIEIPRTEGVYVTMIPANHCPGSSLFLFEKAIGRGSKPKLQRVLHCGDFRACPAHVQHPLLRPDVIDAATGHHREQRLDVCYLDTTYLTPKYAFPRQEEVIKACADMCISLSKEKVDQSDSWEQMKKQRAGSGMTRFLQPDSSKDVAVVDTSSDGNGDAEESKKAKASRGRLLVVVGTYSIGKERICLGVAKALNSKIFAAPGKQRICAALEDPELQALLTTDPLEAQVHMQMLMEIRAETLADYLTNYKPHFSRIVGFRPSGWNYRPPNSRFVESPLVQTVLHSDNWKPSYSMAELVPQRGSTREASCFGVPYSEHSSFRELTMFCCALHIDKIIPTVNVGSAKSREKMKSWIERWAMERRKNGLYKVADDAVAW